MQIRNSSERYGLISQVFHWLTAVLIVLGWALGQGGDLFPKGPPRDAGLFVHMSAGLAVIILTAMRLLWRVADPSPPLEPTPFGRPGEFAARAGHIALFALLVLVPLSGIAVQFARGNALPVFGLMEIASPWTANRSFARSAKGVHELLSNAIVLLALVHAVAALAHHWLLRDRTLLRMIGNR